MTADDRGLELDDDMRAHRVGWIAQRVGWAVMAAILVAACVGLFGRGPLSEVEERAGDRLLVRYERFARARATSELQVVAGPDADGELRVWLGRDLLRDQEVDHVVPEPVRVVSAGDRLGYVFAVGDGLPTTVVFHLQPERPGRHAAEVGVGDASVRFAQYVWP